MNKILNLEKLKAQLKKKEQKIKNCSLSRSF